MNTIPPRFELAEALERYDMPQGTPLDDRMIGALVKGLVQQIASKAEEVCVWIEETDDTMVCR